MARGGSWVLLVSCFSSVLSRTLRGDTDIFFSASSLSLPRRAVTLSWPRTLTTRCHPLLLACAVTPLLLHVCAGLTDKLCEQQRFTVENSDGSGEQDEEDVDYDDDAESEPHDHLHTVARPDQAGVDPEALADITRTVQTEMAQQLKMIQDEMMRLKSELYSETGGLADIQKSLETLKTNPAMQGLSDGEAREAAASSADMADRGGGGGVRSPAPKAKTAAAPEHRQAQAKSVQFTAEAAQGKDREATGRGQGGQADLMQLLAGAKKAGGKGGGTGAGLESMLAALGGGGGGAGGGDGGTEDLGQLLKLAKLAQGLQGPSDSGDKLGGDGGTSLDALLQDATRRRKGGGGGDDGNADDELMRLRRLQRERQQGKDRGKDRPAGFNWQVALVVFVVLLLGPFRGVISEIWTLFMDRDGYGDDDFYDGEHDYLIVTE